MRLKLYKNSLLKFKIRGCSENFPGGYISVSFQAGTGDAPKILRNLLLCLELEMVLGVIFMGYVL